MAKIQTSKDVGVEDVQRTLSEALGPKYRVTLAADSKLKVGRTGMIPSLVTVSHSGGGTTFKIGTSGLIISRLVQAAAVNPRVKHALADAYPCRSQN